MVTVNLKTYAIADYEVYAAKELIGFLRMAGVYPGGGDQLCSGIDLSMKLETCKDCDTIELSDDELNVLKSVLNVLLTKATPPLGGPRYNELITRVFRAGK